MAITVVDGTIPTTTFTILPAMRNTAYHQMSAHPDDPTHPADPRYAADWSQQMAADGCTDLPVSWYRQTPWNAVTRLHGMANLIFVAVMTFAGNVVFGYLALIGDDEVGMWQKAQNTSHPYSSTAVSDLMITSLVIGLINGWTARFAGVQAMKQGWTVMVDPALMSGGFWRLVPFGLHPYLRRGFVGGFLRGLLCAAIVLICFGLPFLLLLEIICTGGGMHGHNSTCTMDKGTYVWVKACFAGVVVAIIFPIVLLMGLHASVLTDADRGAIIEGQRTRWKARQVIKTAPTDV